MVGPGEKGLASSRWAPINTGRPPYYWTSNRFRQSASSSSTSSTSNAIHTTTTTTTSTQPPPPIPSTNTVASLSDGITYTGNPYEADASALTRVPTPWSELSRFMKIARRMRWKLPFLGQGYRAATDRALNTPDDRAEAELMFKLDFFEYYMLLERALVHLMGVFGVKITGAFNGTRSGTRTPNGNGRSGGAAAGQQQQPQSDHRFHANVLDALDDPRNPLHPVLGAGDARYALARAKELRNRWKNADEPDSVVAASSIAAAKLAARPLEDYDLERILENIFTGLEGAYVIADRYVAGVRALAAERGLAAPGAAANGTATPDNAAEETQWEFMVDAMDWEAV
ncbi:hypothetical protein INS49_015662 [Diaporthe citri]|uniref:uncharacterized protein n=1 Tax=Diaporthe citri TaxID=83186 RepID=UPI001C81A9C9|nr:uncharacterized protein INS49_015662 [Diaporthe citri]KAG6356275.1 hypothetical protein INS49_015662 [Diaporthe citri]